MMVVKILSSLGTCPFPVVDDRIMMSGVTKDHWPAYMDEIYRICKPGTGWAQIIETSAYLYCDDNSVPKESKLWEAPSCW
jgi:hypothetical protein